MDATPQPTPPASNQVPNEVASNSTKSVNCVVCGYSLAGLPLDGKCPECGTDVAQSMRGFLIQFASKQYQNEVYQGLRIVLIGILVTIVVSILGFVAGMVVSVGGAAGSLGYSFTLISQGATFLVSLAIGWGYWRLTELDPQFTGTENPASARKLVRIGSVGQIGCGLLVFILSAVSSMTTPTMAANILAGGVSLISLGFWALQFFAMMNYTGWLASRVPDAQIHKRTLTYRWLLPLISIVGAIVLMLGPLVALILYWNLLDRMRKHMKAIIETGEPAQLPGTLA